MTVHERTMEKMKKLRSTFRQADILGLQETHGWQGEIEHALFEQSMEAEVFISPGTDRNKAGVAILIKKSLLCDLGRSRHFELVPGRAHAVTFWSADGEASSTILNVHNFELDDADMRAIRAFALPRSRAAAAAPTLHHLWLIGDLNFDAPGEEPRLLEDWASSLTEGVACRNFETVAQARTAHADTSSRAASRRAAREWDSILGPLVEIADAAPSHFDKG